MKVSTSRHRNKTYVYWASSPRFIYKLVRKYYNDPFWFKVAPSKWLELAEKYASMLERELRKHGVVFFTVKYHPEGLLVEPTFTLSPSPPRAFLCTLEDDKWVVKPC